MKRVRRQLNRWTPLVLALFLSAIAAPRAGLFLHHHADGDHAHIHADGDDHDADHDHKLAAAHHHHDLTVGAAEDEPEIEAPDHDESGHWHAQNRFHRALAPALITVDDVQLVARLRASSDAPIVDRAALPARARGPPLVL
ncbi:MAG: hypothetical protein HYR72_21810 [Deltaproteobacteria bacterium]|nr:hypothetical protein [Deltaproteobacteria bacterium]MBI3390155.1 hypothetical protein [Deltaproteobacteria bacterium]